METDCAILLTQEEREYLLGRLKILKLLGNDTRMVNKLLLKFKYCG